MNLFIINIYNKLIPLRLTEVNTKQTDQGKSTNTKLHALARRKVALSYKLKQKYNAKNFFFLNLRLMLEYVIKEKYNSTHLHWSHSTCY